MNQLPIMLLIAITLFLRKSFKKEIKLYSFSTPRYYAYLIIVNSIDEEVLKWDKARGLYDNNKGEFEIKESGIYIMKIIFTDSSLEDRFAEVEVDWKFVR